MRRRCVSSRTARRRALSLDGIVKSPLSTSEKMTPFKDVASYNNYYEFGTSKRISPPISRTLSKTSP